MDIRSADFTTIARLGWENDIANGFTINYPQPTRSILRPTLADIIHGPHPHTQYRLFKFDIINDRICDLGRVTPAHLAALFVNYQFLPSLGRWANRKHRMVYQLGTIPPNTETQNNLNITDQYRRWFRRDIEALLGESNTATNVGAKVTAIPAFNLIDGVLVNVIFINGNTHNTPTLNINGTGAREIWRNDKRVGERYQIIKPGIILELRFDQENNRYEVTDNRPDISYLTWIIPEEVLNVFRNMRIINRNGRTWFQQIHTQFEYEIERLN